MDNDDRLVKSVTNRGLKRLAGATVAIVGAGSLGGRVGFELAAAKVGKLIYIDPDVLEEHNVFRHIAGVEYVGKPKVDAMAMISRGKNPKVKVVAIQGDVMKNLGELQNADLVVVAGLGSAILTKDLAVRIREMGKKALFGGLYEKGVAGQVLFVDPKEGPCYSCHMSEAIRYMPVFKQEFDYAAPPDEIKAQAGLGVYIEAIVPPLATWVLRILLGDIKALGSNNFNFFLVANEPYEFEPGKWLAPHASIRRTVERKPDCRMCSISFTVRPEEIDIESILE